LTSEFPFLFREAADATRVGSAAPVRHDDLAANLFNMIRVESLIRLPSRQSSSGAAPFICALPLLSCASSECGVVKSLPAEPFPAGFDHLTVCEFT